MSIESSLCGELHAVAFRKALVDALLDVGERQCYRDRTRRLNELDQKIEVSKVEALFLLAFH